MHEEMLTYGLRRGTKNELVYIDEVPNGKDCDCVCPYCQHDLIARNGGIKKRIISPMYQEPIAEAHV